MLLRRTLPSLLLLGVAAGCTPNDALLGGSLRHNYALQVVDPDPKPATDAQPGADGVHAAAAVDRYQKDEVKIPQPIKTTSATSPSK